MSKSLCRALAHALCFGHQLLCRTAAEFSSPCCCAFGAWSHFALLRGHALCEQHNSSWHCCLAQTSLQLCRLLNLELLLQFGPRAWQAHIRHLEVAQQGYASGTHPSVPCRMSETPAKFYSAMTVLQMGACIAMLLLSRVLLAACFSWLCIMPLF